MLRSLSLVMCRACIDAVAHGQGAPDNEARRMAPYVYRDYVIIESRALIGGESCEVCGSKLATEMVMMRHV